jgi:hypothetical protein
MNVNVVNEHELSRYFTMHFCILATKSASTHQSLGNFMFSAQSCKLHFLRKRVKQEDTRYGQFGMHYKIYCINTELFEQINSRFLPGSGALAEFQIPALSFSLVATGIFPALIKMYIFAQREFLPGATRSYLV